MVAFPAAVVTVSDGVARGTRADRSGDLAEELVRGAGFDVVERSVVPDERLEIEARIRALAERGIALIVTTGGTGFGPRDVTPEATRAVIDREAPGLAELMRRAGLEETPMAALSRGVTGCRGATLILNLPGSPKGVRESLEAVLEVVPHALELLSGATGEHPTGHGEEPAVSADAPPASVEPAEESAEAPPEGLVRGVAVKIHGSPPCRLGNRIEIVPDGPVRGTLGCAEFDATATVAAPEILASGEPRTVTLEHDLGEVEVLFEPVLPAARLVVVSATDVARELQAIAHRLGYAPTLLEPRAERLLDADRERPWVIANRLDAVAIDGRTDVVFTDHDAPGIARQLAFVLRSPARFIGVMGSRRHVGPYLDALRAMGFGDEDLARIHSPVGLDLGGQRPEEIAVSIAAGLVASHHGRAGGRLEVRP